MSELLSFSLANKASSAFENLPSNYLFNHLLALPLIYLCGFRSSWWQNLFSLVPVQYVFLARNLKKKKKKVDNDENKIKLHWMRLRRGINSPTNPAPSPQPQRHLQGTPGFETKDLPQTVLLKLEGAYKSPVLLKCTFCPRRSAERPTVLPFQQAPG